MSTSVCWNDLWNHLSPPEFLSIFLVPLLWEEQLFFAIHQISSPWHLPNKKFSPKDIFPPSPRESLKFPSSMEQTEQSGKRRRIWCPFSNLSLNPSAKVAGSFGEAVKGQENSIRSQHLSDDVMKEIHVEWLIWCLICVLSVSLPYQISFRNASINLKSARCRWCHPWHLFLGHRAERWFHWPSPKNWEVTYPTHDEKSSFPTFLRGYVIVPWRFVFH